MIWKYKDICVFAEYRMGKITEETKEVVKKARKLTAETGGRVFVAVSDHIKQEDCKILSSSGADKIITFSMENNLGYDLKYLTEAISYLEEKYLFGCLLFSSTNLENDLASRLGVRLRKNVLTDCMDVDTENGRFLIRCLNHSGEYLTEYSSYEETIILTMKPGMRQQTEDSKSLCLSVEVEKVHIPGKSDLIIKKKKEISQPKEESQDSECIIAFGRGCSRELDNIKKLAALLHADVGTSRPNVDDGLIEKKYQIGLSGKTVRPKVYLAFGISGAMHHVIGMHQSEWVLAVNIDRNAPVFDVADVGVVGDASKILPEMIDLLERKI